MIEVTSDDRGPLVNIAIFIVIGPLVIMAGAKLYTKWDITRQLQLDDAFMVVAVLLAVGQTIATSQTVHFGLGRPQRSLSDREVRSFFLAQYIANVFYIATIFVAKLTGLYFFRVLVGPHSRNYLLYGVISLVIAWIAIGILTVAFGCHLPSPWLKEGIGCIDHLSFWTVSAVIDITTQLFVSLLPIWFLKNLQAAKGKKLLSMFAFTPNLLTIPLAILRLVYLFGTPVTNYTYHSVALTLTTALHASMGVIVSTIPFAKPIIDSMVLAPIIIPNEAQAYGSSRGYRRTLGGPENDGEHDASESAGSKLSKKAKAGLAYASNWPRRNDVGNFVEVSTSPERIELGEAGFGSRERMAIGQTRTLAVSGSSGKGTGVASPAT